MRGILSEQLAGGYETERPARCELPQLDRIDRQDTDVGVNEQQKIIPGGPRTEIAARAEASIDTTYDDVGAMLARNSSRSISRCIIDHEQLIWREMFPQSVDANRERSGTVIRYYDRCYR
jgi:hypothetical protein